MENPGKLGIFPNSHLVVDGKGRCLHGHGQQVHGAVHQGRLKFPAQIHKFLLPGMEKLGKKIVGSIPKKNPIFCWGKIWFRTKKMGIFLGSEPQSWNFWGIFFGIRASPGFAPGLSFLVQEHQAQEVHQELQQHRQHRVQIENIGKRPLLGKSLQGLEKKERE